MFKDFPKKESIDMLTVNKVYGFLYTVVHVNDTRITSTNQVVMITIYYSPLNSLTLLPP